MKASNIQYLPKNRLLSKILIVECGLIHVKHYKMITCWDSGRMAAKKQAAHAQKLMASKRAKTEEELALEEYQRQLELAIENH
jgi:hypothetical protein